MKLYINVPRLLFSLFILLALCLFANYAGAQTLKVATGDPKGNYSRIFKELMAACSNTIQVGEVNTDGSNSNVDMIVRNEVNGAVVQPDVLKFRAFNEDLSGFKTLFTLYPEEIHIVAKAVSGLTSGGTGVGSLRFNTKDVVFNSVDDLNGYKIGAAGGSVITARLIKSVADLKYEVVTFSSNDLAKAALDKGEIQALLLVGGQPMAFVDALGPNYKLLRISETASDKLKAVYSPAKLTYTRMGPAGTGIQTMAQRATFIVVDYKTPKMSSQLLALRSCMTDKLDDLKEKTGNHPKWRTVNPEDKGNWVWYTGTK